jgi:hypothetical protein
MSDGDWDWDQHVRRGAAVASGTALILTMSDTGFPVLWCWAAVLLVGYRDRDANRDRGLLFCSSLALAALVAIYTGVRKTAFEYGSWIIQVGAGIDIAYRLYKGRKSRKQQQ